MNIVLDESIKNAIPACCIGVVVIRDVSVRYTPSTLTQEFIQLQSQVAKAYNLNILPTIPRIISVRSMYKKLDFDPSRYRPASEALVRRILQKKGVYYVNSAVDVNNYCSIKYLLPFGLYDLDQVKGDVTYRVTSEGSYCNIVGNVVSTDGKPFLTDGEGVFGNPTSDSRRTAVTLASKNLLCVVYGDEEVEETNLYNILEFTGNMMIRYNGGIIDETKIIRA